MYFGMKSNDITKDRLEYYASRRPMADGTHRDGRNGRWGFVPHLPPLRRTRFELRLMQKADMEQVSHFSHEFPQVKMPTKIMSRAISLKDLLIDLIRNQQISIKQEFSPNY